jgi:hypothetical protein
MASGKTSHLTFFTGATLRSILSLDYLPHLLTSVSDEPFSPVTSNPSF